MAARGAFALLFATCVACAPLERKPETAAPMDALVAEVVLASRSPPGEQRAALARAEQAFVAQGTAVNRLRLALLLGALSEPLRDDGRALELLEPLADAASPGAGRLAALVSAQLAERRRLVRELERHVRERERADRERERLDKERERLDRERDKREEALRQQIEALRSIERGILEREEKLRRRR